MSALFRAQKSSTWLHVLFYCSWTLRPTEGLIDAQFWTKIPISVNQLLAGPHLEVSTRWDSDILCAIEADKVSSGTYCYDGTRCVLNQGSVDLTGPTEPGWTCKTADSEISTTSTTPPTTKAQPTCTLPDGSSLNLFESTTYDSAVCSTNATCTASGLVGVPYRAEPNYALTPSCCSSPFVMVSGLCLFFGSRLDWCGAQEYCFSVGAKLFSAETEQEAAIVENYLHGDDGIHHWVAGRISGGTWKWNNGGGRPVASTEWRVSHPASTLATDCCYMTYVSSSDKGVGTRSCTADIRTTMCSLRVPAC